MASTADNDQGGVGKGHEGPPGTVRLAPRVFVVEGALRYSAVRSSGPGGQNVNKRSTKVELRVLLDDLYAAGMPPRALRRLIEQVGHLVVGQDEGREVVVTSESQRTQLRNKGECLDRLSEIVRTAMVDPKPRKKTKPTKGSIERRIKAKKEQGEKKRRRSGGDFEG